MPVQAPWACKCGKRVAAGQPCPCCSTARKRTYDANRPNARARGYDNKWDKARADFLAANPWCVRCARYGSQVPATVVNHIIPHKMDLRLFWNRRNWAALCAPCHNGPTQSAEKLGSNTATRWGYSIPSGVQPSLSPVTLVCGPPASGKTTYVKARAAAGDTIIDFDDCLVNIGAQPWSSDASSIAKAFKVRDDMIRALATTRTRMVWLIVSAPSQEERSQWRAALGDVSVVVMETQIEVCIERINADPARAHAAKRLIALAKSWPKGKGRSRPADNARDRQHARYALKLENFWMRKIMAQARTDGKGFDYATVTVNLSGHVTQANIANHFYPPAGSPSIDPMVAMHDDLQRRLAAMRGEPAAPKVPEMVGTPVEVFDRLRKALWTPNDVTTVITLGLIGAGNSLDRATEIVNRHVRSHPLANALTAALAILGMFLVGADGEDTGQ